MGQNCKPYMVLWYLLSIHSYSNPNADILVTNLVLKHCAHALRQPRGCYFNFPPRANGFVIGGPAVIKHTHDWINFSVSSLSLRYQMVFANLYLEIITPSTLCDVWSGGQKWRRPSGDPIYGIDARFNSRNRIRFVVTRINRTPIQTNMCASSSWSDCPRALRPCACQPRGFPSCILKWRVLHPIPGLRECVVYWYLI